MSYTTDITVIQLADNTEFMHKGKPGIHAKDNTEFMHEMQTTNKYGIHANDKKTDVKKWWKNDFGFHRN